jgi:hypothetical protein
MPTRRRLVAAIAVTVAAVLLTAGCGSQTPRSTATPGRNSDSTPVNGTSPSAVPESPRPTIPGETDDYHSDGIVTESGPERSFALTDLTNGDFVAGLSNGDVVIGEIGIHGLGAAWGTHKVQVTRSPDGLVAHYDGPGRLVRNASLDLGLATFTSLSGAATLADSQRARLRFDVRLDSVGLGDADVWIGRHHCHLVAGEPPHTADPVTTAVVTAMRAEDWSAMYDLTVRLPGMTRAAFVRSFGADGSISSLELTGDTVYRVANGVAYADTPAHVLATLGRRHLDRDVTLRLVYGDGEWRYATMAKKAPSE